MPADRAVGRQVPKGLMPRPQRQDGGNPGLRPAGLDAPRAAAAIGIAAPILPAAKVEGAEPAAIEFRMALGANLDAAQEARQTIFGVAVNRFLSSEGRLVEAREGEVGRVQEITQRVAVLLNDGRLAATVAVVGVRRREGAAPLRALRALGPTRAPSAAWSGSGNAPAPRFCSGWIRRSTTMSSPTSPIFRTR